MGTFEEAPAQSCQRSHPGDGVDGSAGNAPALLQRIASLEQELALLREVAREKSELESLTVGLREANENLVLATVTAQELRDDAEAANRRQNEFLAMLAHELRNPLAPIGMSATLLERAPDAEQAARLTQVIRRQVDHMAHLLDDLLDAARISSGKITLALQPLSLAEVVDQALEMVLPRIRERRQRLDVTLPQDDLVVEGDRVRLVQVFTNLLGNASKYTGDDGTIALEVASVEGEIVARIVDNGLGIAADVIPHIFDLFTQGPRSLARSEGGLGVGLNVVRNLVTMHGGAVSAHSAGLGHGSTFTVRLPASLAAPGGAPQPGLPLHGGCCRILLIEDNVDACDTLALLLALEGHQVTSAHDGVSGVDAAINGNFDVIICDIGLPLLDGFGVIRRLRAAQGAHAPFVIALSGYCQAEDRERSLGAGFDHYLVKPVSPDVLLGLIGARARAVAN
jgi:signal transduction histidine kinase